MEKNEAGNRMLGEKASLRKEHFNLKGLGILACGSLREEGSKKGEYRVKRDLCWCYLLCLRRARRPVRLK